MLRHCVDDDDDGIDIVVSRVSIYRHTYIPDDDGAFELTHHVCTNTTVRMDYRVKEHGDVTLSRSLPCLFYTLVQMRTSRILFVLTSAFNRNFISLLSLFLSVEKLIREFREIFLSRGYVIMPWKYNIYIYMFAQVLVIARVCLSSAFH